MTLCIAAKCSDKVGEVNIVSCFDRRVETDIAGSEVGFKFRKVSPHWFAMLAGQVGRAEELIGIYTTYLQDRLLDKFSIPDELRVPTQQFKKKLANEYIQTMLAMSYDDFFQKGQAALPSGLFENMTSDVARMGIGCQLILVPVLPQECAHIFTIDTDGNLALHNDFAAIGTGGTNAYSWLSFRQQNTYTNIADTIVHVLEAKKFSENAPGVGKQTIISWLTHDGTMKDVKGLGDGGLTDKVWSRFGPRKVDQAKHSFKDEFEDASKWDEIGIG